MDTNEIKTIGRSEQTIWWEWNATITKEMTIDTLVSDFDTALNMTLYRIASESFFVRARVEAARNGKKGTAFVEMKESVDEEIRKAQAGKRAFVILKVDNLDDPAIRSQMEIDRFLKEKADGDA